MTAAHDFISRPSSPIAPEPPESGVGVVRAAEVAALDMADVLSLPPQSPPPPRARVATDGFDDEPTHELAVPDAEYAALSLEATGDDELLVLLAQKRNSKRKAIAACLAFPAVIALVLVALGSGEGRPKDAAMKVMSVASSTGDTVYANVERDRRELEAIRAELSLAEKLAQQDAERDAKGERRRSLPR